MKQNIAYYLLLLYLTVLFRPLAPVIGDSAAHFFAAAYHEAMVHARFGAHHVDKEVADGAAENSNTKQLAPARTDEPGLSYHNFLATAHPVSNGADISSYNAFPQPSLLGIICLVQSPPPRLSTC